MGVTVSERVGRDVGGSQADMLCLFLPYHRCYFMLTSQVYLQTYTVYLI